MSDTFLVGDVEVKVDSATVTIGYDDYPVRNIQMVKLVPYKGKTIIGIICGLGFWFSTLMMFGGLIHFLQYGNTAFYNLLFWYLLWVTGLSYTATTKKHVIRFDNSKAGQALAQPIWTFMDGVKACLFFTLSQSKYDNALHNIKSVADRIKQAVHALQHTS